MPALRVKTADGWVEIKGAKGDPGLTEAEVNAAAAAAVDATGVVTDAAQAISGSSSVSLSAIRPGRIDAKSRGLSSANTASQNAAILSAIIFESATEGGEAWIGDGEFPTDPATLISHARIGGNGTLQRPGNDPILSGSAVEDATLSGIALEGAYTSGAISGGSAIVITGSGNDLRVRGVTVRNWSNAAISLQGCADVWVEDSTFDTLAGSGVYMALTEGTDYNERIHVLNNTFRGVQKSGTYGHGAVQTRAAGNPTRDLWVVGNEIDGARVGVGADHVHRAYVRDNRIVNCQGEAVAFSGRDLDVSGNHFEDCGASGVLYWGTTVPSGTMSGFRVTNNTIKGCNPGVCLVAAENGHIIDDVMVAFNRLKNNTTFGFQSFAYPGVTTWQYGSVTVAFNEAIGNASGALNFSVATSGSARHFGNITGNGRTSAITGTQMFWDRLQAIRGTDGTLSTEIGLSMVHQDGGAVNQPSEMRVVGGFSASLPNSKMAGFGARKTSAFANDVDLALYAWSGSAEWNGLTLTKHKQIQTAGSLAVPVRTVTAATVVAVSDHIVLADASSGAFTVELRYTNDVLEGTMYTIKKIDTSANAVTVDAFTTQQIDGALTYVLSSAHQFVTVVRNGGAWRIVAKG